MTKGTGSNMLRKILTLAATSAVLGVLVMGASGTAFASNENTQFSQTLAGTALQGNGTDIINGTWRQISVPANPSEGGAFPIAPDSLAVGIVLADSVNVNSGDRAYGEALVWADGREGACGTSSWTLEYTPAVVHLISASATGFPIPTSQLEPLDGPFGSPVCTNNQFMYLYQSHKFAQMDFSAGPSSKDFDVLATDFGAWDQFRTGASGVNTTTGTNAQDVATGTLLANSGVGYFINGLGNSVFGQGVNLTKLNYQTFEGTLTGGVPGGGNPLTLTVSPASGPAGAYSITAP